MKIDLPGRAQFEIINKSGLRYPLADAEKDYFQTIILQLIYDSSLKDNLVFKGGTALYHCYLEQLRFSEDLDFTAPKPLEYVEINSLFEDYEIFVLKKLEERKYSVNITVQYRGILSQPNSVRIDINTNQKVLLPPKVLEYRNNYGLQVKCKVMDVREIAAEKIRALNERPKPRDLYDLYLVGKYFDLGMKEVVDLLRKKEMFLPLTKQRISDNCNAALEAFEKEIERLYYREATSKDELKTIAKQVVESL